MRNLPYSTPQIKKKAIRQVVQSQKKSSSFAQTLILFFVIPLGLYFLCQNPSVRENVLVQAIVDLGRAQFERVHSLAEPYLYKLNLTIFDFAQKNEANIEALNKNIPQAFLPQNVRAIPADKLIAKTSSESTYPAPELLPLDYYNPAFTKEDFLNDRFNRVPEFFKIPSGLRKRVGFWLDIYTRYSSRYHVIHHVDYPWLILKVVDTTPIYLGPGHRWSKYHKAEAAVKKTLALVRQDLIKLSRMKSYNKLTEDQQRYYDLFADLPGPRARVFARAASHIRTQLGQKDFYKSGLITSSKYLPQMEEIFAQYDLPVELTRLPLVESSFNEEAISKVGASGIWQFMPHIGKSYLHINGAIDERNSPLKATEAAAKLMLSNFRMMKNWPFAVTAYNHGPGGIRKASIALRTEDLSVIIEKYNSDRFGFASSNFYTSFLAALHAERYQEEIFGQIPKYPAHRSDTIQLTRQFRAGDIATITGITMEELKLFNKDLKVRAVSKNTLLPRGYRIFVPQGRKARFELHQIELKEAARSKRDPRVGS